MVAVEDLLSERGKEPHLKKAINTRRSLVKVFMPVMDWP